MIPAQNVTVFESDNVPTLHGEGGNSPVLLAPKLHLHRHDGVAVIDFSHVTDVFWSHRTACIKHYDCH
jgi:hypothetical protein